MEPIMKNLHLLLSLLLFVSAAPVTPGSPSAEELNVVTTIPDLADIVREIGGDRVDVKTITRGRENLHAVTARPSHLVALSRADMFVQVGLSLEAVFVPGLLESARNTKIRPGAAGFVNTSDGWDAIDVPASVSRQGGDLHPYGNPHLNLDPRGGEHMAEVIRDALVQIDPGSKDLYERRHAAYAEKLAEARKRWDALTDRLRGRKIVVYHQEFNYLARYHGIEIVDAIELRPGIPPTPNHLAEVIGDMKREGVKVILVAHWSRNRDVERVAEATGARIVEVPSQAGGTASTETWIGMMDELHAQLVTAFSGE
jgi:ABC-type Zn uptake system ZnuABC Zn-binding protein ZnuA